MTKRELRRECLEQAHCSECPFFDECDLENKVYDECDDDYDDYYNELELARNAMDAEIYD